MNAVKNFCRNLDISKINNEDDLLACLRNFYSCLHDDFVYGSTYYGKHIEIHVDSNKRNPAQAYVKTYFAPATIVEQIENNQSVSSFSHKFYINSNEIENFFKRDDADPITKSNQRSWAFANLLSHVSHEFRHILQWEVSINHNKNFLLKNNDLFHYQDAIFSYAENVYKKIKSDNNISQTMQLISKITNINEFLYHKNKKESFDFMQYSFNFSEIDARQFSIKVIDLLKKYCEEDYLINDPDVRLLKDNLIKVNKDNIIREACSRKLYDKYNKKIKEAKLVIERKFNNVLHKKLGYSKEMMNIQIQQDLVNKMIHFYIKELEKTTEYYSPEWKEGLKKYCIYWYIKFAEKGMFSAAIEARSMIEYIDKDNELSNEYLGMLNDYLDYNKAVHGGLPLDFPFIDSTVLGSINTVTQIELLEKCIKQKKFCEGARIATGLNWDAIMHAQDSETQNKLKCLNEKLDKKLDNSIKSLIYRKDIEKFKTYIKTYEKLNSEKPDLTQKTK